MKTHRTPARRARPASGRTFRWAVHVLKGLPAPARPAHDGSSDCMVSCGVSPAPLQRAQRRRAAD